MNVKDRMDPQSREKLIRNSSSTTEKWKQLLDKALEEIQSLKSENKTLRMEKSQLDQNCKNLRQELMQVKQTVKEKNGRIKELEEMIDKMKKPFGRWLVDYGNK